jgi:hypothetical protein
MNNSSSACPLDGRTIFAVGSGIGGAGNGSAHWERAFFSWWEALDARVEWAEMNEENVAGGCGDLNSFDSLAMYVQPGGDSYEQQKSLGTHGRNAITSFLDGDETHKYMGTCAGWYFATSDYWWEGTHYGFPAEPSLLGRYPATVEGSITDIQDYASYPAYSVTGVTSAADDGQSLSAVYYGGPTIGWNDTPLDSIPSASAITLTFDSVGGGGTVPAGLVHDNKLLLWSVHLEAYEGTFDTWTDGRPIHIEIDGDDVEANYKFRAQHINEILGTDFNIE